MIIGILKATPPKKQHQRLYTAEDVGGDGVGIESTKITESLKNKQNNKAGEGGGPIHRVAKPHYLKNPVSNKRVQDIERNKKIGPYTP